MNDTTASTPAPALLCLTSVADQAQATTLATHLLEKRLVACVSSIPQIQSMYHWKGKIETAQEILLLCKTTATKQQDLMAEITALLRE